MDCTKAYLPVDFVICSDPEVVRANEAHEQAWYSTRARLSDTEKKELLRDQRQWLKEYPSRCGIPQKGNPLPTVSKDKQQCVARALEERAAFLQQYHSISKETHSLDQMAANQSADQTSQSSTISGQSSASGETSKQSPSTEGQTKKNVSIDLSAYTCGDLAADAHDDNRLKVALALLAAYTHAHDKLFPDNRIYSVDLEEFGNTVEQTCDASKSSRLFEEVVMNALEQYHTQAKAAQSPAATTAPKPAEPALPAQGSAAATTPSQPDSGTKTGGSAAVPSYIVNQCAAEVGWSSPKFGECLKAKETKSQTATVAPSQSPPSVANQEGTKSALQAGGGNLAESASVWKAFDLPGIWSLNCAKEASGDNPRLFYNAPSIGLSTLIIYRGSGGLGLLTLRHAEMIDDTKLRSILEMENGGIYDVLLQKKENHLVLTRGSDDQNANSETGKPPPAYERCQEGSAPIALQPVSLVSKKPESGWISYRLTFAAVNQTSSSIHLYPDYAARSPSSAGRQVAILRMTGFAETRERQHYSVEISLGRPKTFGSPPEFIDLPPGIPITAVSTWSDIFTISFKIPELLHPRHLVLFPGVVVPGIQPQPLYINLEPGSIQPVQLGLLAEKLPASLDVGPIHFDLGSSHESPRHYLPGTEPWGLPYLLLNQEDLTFVSIGLAAQNTDITANHSLNADVELVDQAGVIYQPMLFNQPSCPALNEIGPGQTVRGFLCFIIPGSYMVKPAPVVLGILGPGSDKLFTVDLSNP